jgi:hypothetical protein
MATGQNLLQRFYYRQPLTPRKPEKRFLHDAFTVAMGYALGAYVPVFFSRAFPNTNFQTFEPPPSLFRCVFLASKIEEKPKRPREIIYVFHHMCRLRRGLPPAHLDIGKNVRPRARGL